MEIPITATESANIQRLEDAESSKSLKDALAQRIIMQTIDKKHLTLIMTCESAYHMYKNVLHYFCRLYFFIIVKKVRCFIV